MPFCNYSNGLFLSFRHTAGWFPFRRRPQARPHNQPAPEVVQNQQNQNEDRHPEPVSHSFLFLQMQENEYYLRHECAYLFSFCLEGAAPC